MNLKTVAASCLVFVVSASGCDRLKPTGATNAPQPPTPPVTITVVSPTQQPVKRTIEQPGTIFPFEETVLYPKIPGFVASIAADPDKATRPEYDRLIDIGSKVKRDQILVELAVPELEEEYKQKEALVRQAEAEVTQAKKALDAANAGVNSAKAQINEAKAGLSRADALYERWQSESARVNRLVASGVIDSQTRDETLNQFKAAEASQNEAKAKVTSAEAMVTKAEADRDKVTADVSAMEAKADVAKADRRRVEALLSYLRIKAPYDGIITRSHVNRGDYVTADGKQGLFAIARTDPVRIVLHVPEADAGMVNVGQPLTVSLVALPGPPLAGVVVRTSWSLEPGSRTLRTEADLPNPDNKVRPGMYVNAKLNAELPAAWALPTTGITKFNGDPVAFVIDNGKATRVLVQQIRGDAQFTQITGYKKANATEWKKIDGNEKFATPATSVTDGQAMP